MMKEDVKLVKILIGSAWLDGRIQPEERQYLHQIAIEKGVASDPEIQPLLHESRIVPQTACYEWVKEYLGERPMIRDCYGLIEAISGLIYSDGEVTLEEAELLTKLQSSNPADMLSQPSYNAILREIQKLYRRWVDLKA